MRAEFPTGWRLLRLEDSVDTLIDYRGKTPGKTAAGIPLITARIVKNGRINAPEEFIRPEDYDGWMRRGLPEAGDVVLTTEAPLGEVAQLDGSKVALAQRLITMRGRPGILDNNYLKFLMQSPFVQHQLHARATGTTVLGIRQSELRKVRLVLPPLSQQRLIAHILGTLDDKIELNRRMNETLEAMARAIFKSWFVDFDPVRAKAAGRRPSGMDAETAALFPASLQQSELGRIPSGWRVAPIGDLVNAVGGSTPRTDHREFWEGGTIHWATPKDLSGLGAPVLLDTERRITEKGLRQISSGLLPAGTVLLSSRAPIGYLAISEVPLAVNQGFIAMVCDRGVSNQYVLQWAWHNMDSVMGRAGGTTFQEISKGSFRSIQALRPSDRVLDGFAAAVEPLHRAVVENLKECRRLTALRDALLPKLLSGQIRIRDAEKAAQAHL